MLWLDTFFLWARLDGEAGDNKVLLIYSPAGVQEPLVVPPLGAKMQSHGRVPKHPSAPLGPGAITGDGGASESSVGTYSRPMDPQ